MWPLHLVLKPEIFIGSDEYMTRFLIGTIGVESSSSGRRRAGLFTGADRDRE